MHHGCSLRVFHCFGFSTNDGEYYRRMSSIDAHRGINCTTTCGCFSKPCRVLSIRVGGRLSFSLVESDTLNQVDSGHGLLYIFFAPLVGFGLLRIVRANWLVAGLAGFSCGIPSGASRMHFGVHGCCSAITCFGYLLSASWVRPAPGVLAMSSCVIGSGQFHFAFIWCAARGLRPWNGFWCLGVAALH